MKKEEIKMKKMKMEITTKQKEKRSSFWLMLAMITLLTWSLFGCAHTSQTATS